MNSEKHPHLRAIGAKLGRSFDHQVVRNVSLREAFEDLAIELAKEAVPRSAMSEPSNAGAHGPDPGTQDLTF